MTTQITLQQAARRASEYLLRIEPHVIAMHGNSLLKEHKLISRELCEALAQPEQEPVAWGDEQLKMLNFLYGAGDFDGVWFEEKHPTERGAFWWREHLRRLFDTPPQRKPLTKTQISEACLNVWGSDYGCVINEAGQVAIAKAIEAAHGIKGDV